MAFATASDVADRLGRTLTSEQETLATAVIADVTGLITDAVGKDSAWAAVLNPVPQTLQSLCVEKAAGAVSNPDFAIASESLGAHSVTYARSSDNGVFLTNAEERRARRAVFGRLADSVPLGSIFEETDD